MADGAASRGGGVGTVDSVTRVVAIVPAFRRADTVADTVVALLRIVDRVVVVDDGSGDSTAEVARAAGAEVVVLPVNQGKGAAVAAGVAAAPDAAVVVLLDADIGATATPQSIETLIEPVRDGSADMTVGVLPPAGSKGGFGLIKRLSSAGVKRACGLQTEAPLSGQRAIRGELARSLDFAARFGLEVGLTIDVVRGGGRVVEVPVELDHRHTGRSVAGFAHRARQGRDIVRALWPRLTSARQRILAIVLAAVVAAVAMWWSGGNWEARSTTLAAGNHRVVLLGVANLTLADFDNQDLPALHAALEQGAFGSTSVRTVSGGANPTEAYASLGASARLRVSSARAADVFGAGDAPDGAEILAQRQGAEPPADAEVFVTGLPAAVNQNAGAHVPNTPGALGDALHAADLHTAVVGVGDSVDAVTGEVTLDRPAAYAVVDRSGVVDFGELDRDTLLVADPGSPGGLRSSPAATVAATTRVLQRGADVVVVDPGDLDRLRAAGSTMAPAARTAARRAALDRLDETVALMRDRLPADVALVVLGVTPPAGEWRLTPAVVLGRSVEPGTLHSPATRRSGLVTLTDVAPTVLQLVGADVPTAMIGSPWKVEPQAVDLGDLRTLDRDAAFRERIYFPIVLGYIIGQALLYLLLMTVIGRLGGVGRAEALVRGVVLSVAAFPVATFLLRLVPGLATAGSGVAIVVLVAVSVAIAAAALRSRRGPVAGLGVVCGLTVLVLTIDISTGGRLQVASLLGYSPHTAGRFFGIGNTAFAVLTASALIWACVHVAQAPRRLEALVSAGAVLALVVLVDGAPDLGSDVGGILTMVPVFGLTMWALAGRRISWRTVAIATGAMVVLLALATGVDLLRPAADRTHLGRFVTDIVNGDSSTFLTTVQRKLATNVRVFTRSIWTWTVPIIAVFGLFMLVWDRRGLSLLPARSPYRIATVAVLAAGLLGFAVNDSGVVVTALMFVYVAPFLTLLALAEQPGRHTVNRAGTPAGSVDT